MTSSSYELGLRGDFTAVVGVINRFTHTIQN
jgi:hypothetical protein